MSLWNGQLCNSVSDIVLDSAIAVAIVGAYVPQLYRVQLSGTTHGISPRYLLFNALFNNAQLSTSVLDAAYAWPHAARPVLFEIARGKLRGLAAFGALLGLVQIFVQWTCSIAMLMQYAYVQQDDRAQARKITVVAFLHAAIFLFPAAVMALPGPSRHSFDIDIPLALIPIANALVALCFVLLQFYAQYHEIRRRSGDPGALSILSLCLQIIIVTALASRWRVRIGSATFKQPDGPGSPLEWYEWAMAPINYAIHVAGCIALLICYAVAARYGSARSVEDRTPLLGQ